MDAYGASAVLRLAEHMALAQFGQMVALVPYDVARAWLRKIAAELDMEPANIARQAGFSTTALTNCYYSEPGDKRQIKLKTLRTVARKFNKPLGEIDPSGDPPAPTDPLAVAIEIVEKVFAEVPEDRLSAAQRARAIREAQAVLARHFPTKP